ncbi:AbrB family transcriptional regulator [Halalkalibacter oceani]|uniref:AbrB family transcriptional regulator n=1 Tax=Halalkalibacter oceani TaxID=1653776 RepID=UPI003396FFE2
MQKILYLIIAITVGGLCALGQVPAGWLLGSLVTGLICAFFIKKLYFPDSLFKVALAIIGATIGFRVIPEQFITYRSLLLPFVFVFLLTITGGLLLGKFMQRFSSLHPNTAFFCCMPGGASEVIALSKEYGADQQVVAAFHTTRITVFVLFIPLIIGLNVPIPAQNGSAGGVMIGDALLSFVCIGGIGLVTLLLGKRIPLPGSSLFLAIALGFVFHQWVVPTLEIPSFVSGIAQGLMGAIIGIRFDKETLLELKEIGGVSLMTLALYFVMSFGLAGLFYLLTPLEFFTSLLSVVPAGAAEMASTATALHVEPMMVATLQMMRVLTLFAALPFLIKWFSKPVNERKKVRV